MSDEGIVGSLTYLSGYLDETKARVRELEKELEDRNSPVKDEPGAFNTRLQDLESENEALRQELVAVKASGKVKKERTDVKLESPDVDPSAATVPNSALADSRQMCRKLEEQCADLQKKIQETTELAAKALRERVEGEKTMDSVRRELKELRKTNDAANEASAAEIEAKDAAIDSLKAKNKTLRTVCYGA
ncbi:hypothetical protein C8R43DRAFT_1047718 [Mycena crocata]|nr:hypothetical protein C8R43DRAFT_1047718 [Mycena crocata]